MAQSQSMTKHKPEAAKCDNEIWSHWACWKVIIKKRIFQKGGGSKARKGDERGKERKKEKEREKGEGRKEEREGGRKDHTIKTKTGRTGKARR